MSSITHEVSMMLLGYATRRKFAVIEYDDAVQAFAPGFPWFMLRSKIAEKANAAQVEFRLIASGTDAEVAEAEQPLTGE